MSTKKKNVKKKERVKRKTKKKMKKIIPQMALVEMDYKKKFVQIIFEIWMNR